MLSDGQTGMTKLIVAFCNFANAPKDGTLVRVEVTVSASQLPFLRIRKNVGRQNFCTQKDAAHLNEVHRDGGLENSESKSVGFISLSCSKACNPGLLRVVLNH